MAICPNCGSGDVKWLGSSGRENTRCANHYKCRLCNTKFTTKA